MRFETLNATMDAPRTCKITTAVVLVLALTITIGVLTTPSFAANRGPDDAEERETRVCSATATTLFTACKNEVLDDYFRARAICMNVSDDEERETCFADAKASRREGQDFCRAQLTGRRDACGLLGENRYDPQFDPTAFDDDFTNLTNPNPYFPLGIGNRWEYVGGNEVNTVEVLNETKRIEGVTCIVVQDRVIIDGDLNEDTDDWFCQAKNGNVYYLGEEVKDFDSFDGDNPRLPELVSMDGSFKHGREGDKGGLFFSASPTEGLVYLEEFSLGNAEDVTEILSTTYEYGSDSELDRFVPRQLTEIFCAQDCVVTKNYSLLEPGIFARKYYGKGIGFFLEIKPDTGETVQLVGCNFDPRCTGLPAP